MTSIELRIDPSKLANPDLDIRYVLPDLIAERSRGKIRSTGYDYEGDVFSCMILYFEAEDPSEAIAIIQNILKNETVLENSLRLASSVRVVA